MRFTPNSRLRLERAAVTMRAWLAFAASMPLFGCSTALLRPVATTEAATDLQQITRSSANELDPAISPDGKAIAYEVTGSPGGSSHVEVRSLAEPGRLIYASEQGAEPAWMPDGTSIVFVGKTPSSRSEILQTLGQGVRPVFLADVGDPFLAGSWPAVSGDGKLVAMSLDDVSVQKPGWNGARSYDHALGITDLLGSRLKTVGRGTDPAWSPDGKHLAFARVTGGHAHVFVADADGSNAVQITDGPEDDLAPAFSPDGGTLAFCSAHLDDGRLTRANLFLVHLDGSGLVQLTEGDRVACRPAWGRDGLIYFHANARTRFHIWRIRPRGDLSLGGDWATPG